MPEIPVGFRPLKSGEVIQAGDFEWMGKEWLEIALIDPVGRTVPAPREDFYCRKFS